MVEIRSTVHVDYLKIYFNDTLHLSIYLGDLIGVQAWVESESWYYVEYTFRDGAKITSIYESVDVWKAVLKIIEDHA